MSNEVVSNSNFGNGKKTLRAYITGLVLSLFFTVVAFYLVGEHILPTVATYIAITILAILQLMAQVVYFLRMNVSPEGRWNSMPFIFAIVIILVLVFGSLWIMVNLNYNMMN